MRMRIHVRSDYVICSINNSKKFRVKHSKSKTIYIPVRTRERVLAWSIHSKRLDLE